MTDAANAVSRARTTSSLMDGEDREAGEDVCGEETEAVGDAVAGAAAGVMAVAVAMGWKA